MQYLYLFIVVISVAAQSIIQKEYDVKTGNTNVFSFCGVFSFAALLFFVAASGLKFEFNLGIIPYALAFTVAYTVSCVSGVVALSCGSMGITILVSSYSLLIPTFYGIGILNEKISHMTYIGILLLAITLFLLNFRNEKIVFSAKWLVCIILNFVGNGMCSTIQKMQQLKFNGNYKNELMIIVFILVTVIFFVIAIIKKEKLLLKQSFPYATLKGAANGIMNLLVMVLTGTIPNAILFPAISAGKIVIGFFAAVFIYRERLSKMQYFAYALGIASVIFLNL